MTLQQFLDLWNDGSDTMSVQTSGSTGAPKSLLVEKKRMLASAKMTCDFLNLKKGDTALLCMSLEHIGAEMMVVRAIERKLNLINIPVDGHPMKHIETAPDFAAMVPLQVYNSLQNDEEKEKLKRIKHLIIGGGGIGEKTQDALKEFPNFVWSTYGMTETLSHIALRRLNGEDASDWYRPFENVRLRLTAENCLAITAPSVLNEEIITNDIAEIRDDGFFKILGRKDNTIISGGVKIQIEEVERSLGIDNEPPKFAIGALGDEKFGQIVVLVCQNNLKSILENKIRSLHKYWQPKHIVCVDSIPTTDNGKIARKRVDEIIKKYFDASNL